MKTIMVAFLLASFSSIAGSIHLVCDGYGPDGVYKGVLEVNSEKSYMDLQDYGKIPLQVKSETEFKSHSSYPNKKADLAILNRFTGKFSIEGIEVIDSDKIDWGLIPKSQRAKSPLTTKKLKYNLECKLAEKKF